MSPSRIATLKGRHRIGPVRGGFRACRRTLPRAGCLSGLAGPILGHGNGADAEADQADWCAHSNHCHIRSRIPRAAILDFTVHLSLEHPIDQSISQRGQRVNEHIVKDSRMINCSTCYVAAPRRAC
jgi:hypothetical protein